VLEKEGKVLSINRMKKEGDVLDRKERGLRGKCDELQGKLFVVCEAGAT